MNSYYIEDNGITVSKEFNINSIGNNKEPKHKEPKINWSAQGSVSVEQAREYANKILEVCDRVESNSWDYID